MNATYWLSKFGKVVDDDQVTCVAIVRKASFLVVVLHQLIEIPTLEIFEMKTNIAGSVPYVLIYEALADVLPDTAANTRPRVLLLDARHDFADALVHGTIVRADTTGTLRSWRVVRLATVAWEDTSRRGHHLNF